MKLHLYAESLKLMMKRKLWRELRANKLRANNLKKARVYYAELI
jgi:hypothetical protein